MNLIDLVLKAAAPIFFMCLALGRLDHRLAVLDRELRELQRSLAQLPRSAVETVCYPPVIPESVLPEEPRAPLPVARVVRS